MQGCEHLGGAALDHERKDVREDRSGDEGQEPDDDGGEERADVNAGRRFGGMFPIEIHQSRTFIPHPS